MVHKQIIIHEMRTLVQCLIGGWRGGESYQIHNNKTKHKKYLKGKMIDIIVIDQNKKLRNAKIKKVIR